MKDVLKKWIITIFSLALFIPVNIMASIENKQNTISIEFRDDQVVKKIIDNINEYSKIMPVIDNGAIHLGDKFYRLFVTYENNDKALLLFKNKYAHELLVLSDYYKLKELDSENYDSYKMCLYECENQEIIESSKISEMLDFLDIYENYDINLKMINIANKYIEKEDQSLLQELYDLQPVYNLDLPLVNAATVSSGLVNLSYAIIYCDSYAQAGNPNYYMYSSDCTNFVSQVLHYSGKPMTPNYGVNSGWWYVNSYNRSNSWINAQSFCSYLGVTSGFHNINNLWNVFEQRCQPGYIIGYDKTTDGSIDHLAFVTRKQNGKIQIAQHTSNYIKYSDQTNWPTYAASSNITLYMIPY